jgi:hypothetical protein
MTRVTSDILKSASSETLLAQATLFKSIAAPIVKAVTVPAFETLEAAFARAALKRGVTVGGSLTFKELVATQAVQSIERLSAAELQNPKVIMAAIWGMRVQGHVVGDMAVKSTVSLAGLAASASALKQVGGTLYAEPQNNAGNQMADLVASVFFWDVQPFSNIDEGKTIEYNRIRRALLPAFEKAEKKLREQQKIAKSRLTINKPKVTPYRQVPIVVKLPVVVEGKPVPKVAKLPSLDEIIPKIFRGKKRAPQAEASQHKQPNAKVSTESDKEQDNKPLIASRTVIYFEKDTAGKDKLVGNSTYIKLERRNSNKVKNLVIHRLIHSVAVTGASDEYKNRVFTGHDAIHLISGFGLAPKSAMIVGVEFPMTGIDAKRLGLNPPESAQRNINGILLESITEALYLSMIISGAIDDIEFSVPKKLQYYCKKILENLQYFTQRETEYGSIKSGSDFARHAKELSNVGMGYFGYPSHAQKKGRRYRPYQSSTDIHIKNFRFLLENNSGVRKELRKNMDIYLNFVSQAEYNKAHGLPMPAQKLRLRVSPKTTEMLIKTALKGLEELYTNHKSPAIMEFINFYKALLRGDKNPTPTVVFNPMQNIKSA